MTTFNPRPFDSPLSHDRLLMVPRQSYPILDDPWFVYAGSDLGHTYTPTSTRFRIWAPTATGVELLLYDGPEAGEAEVHNLLPDQGGTWVTDLVGDLNGRHYTFRISTGSQQFEVLDPYAKAVGVNALRALVVNLRETDPPGWAGHRRPALTAPTEAIIYELHVRDFSSHPDSGIRHKGRYLAFTETGTRDPSGAATGIDHLKELGVTHVHLLPVQMFATVDERQPDAQYNWGYDPKAYNVPAGAYATDPNGVTRIREFKQMVQALHEAGIAVVMDVVYNHTFTGAHAFEAIAPFYYYRWDDSGQMSNGSGTGNETASERPMMRKFMVDSVTYWAKEYAIDGFRFDLMGLHDRETMRQIREALDAINPGIILYGEPWTGGPSVLDWSQRMVKGAQQGMRIGVFNDNLRNAIKGDNDGTGRGYATGDPWARENVQRGVVGATNYKLWVADFAKEPGESINYVSSHDNLTLWDKIANSNRDDPEEIRIAMDLLSQAIIFTSQGVAFMAGGEELLRTKGMNRNSYDAGDAVNWLDYTRKQKYPQVFRYYQGLIGLRRAHPALRLRTAEEIKAHLVFLESPPDVIAFWLKEHAGGDPWANIVVIYNPGREPVQQLLPAPGVWLVAAAGDQIASEAAPLPPAVDAVTVPPISMMLLYQP